MADVIFNAHEELLSLFTPSIASGRREITSPRPRMLVLMLAVAMQGCITADDEAAGHFRLNVPAVGDAASRSGISKQLITLENLMNMMEIGGANGQGLSVSPDGNYMAFELHQADTTINDYRAAWFIAPAAPGAPVNVGEVGDPTIFRSGQSNGRIGGAWIADYASWSPDSRGIAYRKRTNGETQVWWSSLDGSEKKQLTYNAADVEAFSWNDNGSKLYFTTDADRDDLQTLNASRSRGGHVFDYDADWSSINAKPFYPRYTLIGGRPRVWVLDMEASVERIASAADLVEYEQIIQSADKLPDHPLARHVTHSKDQTGVAWLVPVLEQKQGRNPPMTLYASRSADGRDPVRCPAEECTGIFDITRPLRDGLYWSTIEGEIFYVRKEGMGYSKRSLYGWKIGQERVREVLTTDEWISDCTIVRGRALCFRETPSKPRTIVSIDLADGSIDTVVDPNPVFHNVVVGNVERMEWKNIHGYGTFGYLVKPPDFVPGRRYPLVIVGYRARYALRGGVGNEYPVHLLAANGFVVLVYDKPTTYEAQERYADLMDINSARWGPDLFDVRMPLASFEAAIRMLADRGIVDPTRVGVTGLSNGVSHVNYALIHSDLFAAAITSSSDFGPSNYFLAGARRELSNTRNSMGLGRYGSPEGFMWEHLSLAVNADRVKAPLLINGADNEHLSALEEAITLIENQKPVEMVVYPDEYHIKWQPAHRAAVYERNVDWFNFWLRGVEDSSPGKTEQYTRWRKLREQHVANLKTASKEYGSTLPTVDTNPIH